MTLHWIELDHTEEYTERGSVAWVHSDGICMPFPSEEAFEAAQDWYNSSSNSKKGMVDYCLARGISLDDPLDGTRLLDCWADIAMATYAWHQADPKMIPVVHLLSKVVVNP